MKRNPENRCPNCKVHLDNCFCQELIPFSLKTKLSLIIYKKEAELSTNTAHVAYKILTNSEHFYRGFIGEELSKTFVDHDNYHPIFLFPSEDSTELTPELLSTIQKPVNLIVPDGTWRQAKKIYRRTPQFNLIQQVKITPKQTSIYPFRKQKFDEGLCTYEAIAHALKIIEGEAVYEKLMDNFDTFIQAHLKNRESFKILS